MQVLERTATVFIVLALAIPYLVLMNGALLLADLFVGAEDRLQPVRI